jgi:uncharacterized protein YrzB (UPF0473 family)
MFDQVRYFAQIAFIIVVVLFIDSFNRSFKTQEHQEDHDHHHHHDAKTDSFLHAKLFQAQRNMYLTGSVIFLSLVLNRFYKMLIDIVRNEEKMEILKQQAAKTTKEYLLLLDKDQQKGDSGEVSKLKKELEIVKKQAEQTNQEYLRLTDRYTALENAKSGNAVDKKKD